MVGSEQTLEGKRGVTKGCEGHWHWRGRDFKAKVLFSQKGVATQILLQAKSSFFLLDCGDGTLRDLLSLGEEWIHALHGVFLSHDHPDHTAGLFALLSFLRLRGRKEALVMASPSRQLELGINRYRDSFFGGFPFEIEFWESSSSPIRLCGCEASAFSVPHRERTSFFGTAGLVPAVGYTFIGRTGERVVYSGDTGWFEGLRSFFQDADLAVIEATFSQPKGEGRHLTLGQAEELAKLARYAILVHR
ncbi:MAG: MBL fold metallo-hydrolase [Coprothermobacterota bacterium]|nr:MBL fold metallo-hydrolase [Coprothermobacterota bacterium]